MSWLFVKWRTDSKFETKSIKLTSDTDSEFLNSMYAIPLNRFVLLHVIKRTSRTLPTLEKNSSKSRARTRCDNCMQKIVRASRSSRSISSSEREYLLLLIKLDSISAVQKENRNSLFHVILTDLLNSVVFCRAGIVYPVTLNDVVFALCCVNVLWKKNRKQH